LGAKVANNEASDRTESVIELLARVRDGDDEAKERLTRLHVQRLERWARGRVPEELRETIDVRKLVEDTLREIVQKPREAQPGHEAALFLHLRQALLNLIRDEIRRAPRLSQADVEAGPSESALMDLTGTVGSSLELTIGQAAFERYEKALQRLPAEDREAIIARVELELPVSELARVLGKPSAVAASTAVRRAFARLAAEMLPPTQAGETLTLGIDGSMGAAAVGFNPLFEQADSDSTGASVTTVTSLVLGLSTLSFAVGLLLLSGSHLGAGLTFGGAVVAYEAIYILVRERHELSG
jgi:DNA-directed RNA polymerase specialized sigma24 family protein